MTGVLETIIIVAATKIVSMGIDYGIKKSKSTHNTLDDKIFAVLGAIQPYLKLINIKKLKFKK